VVVVVVCAGTEKGSRAGSWNTGGSEKREKEGSRVKGEVEGSRHADPPEAPHNPGGRFK